MNITRTRSDAISIPKTCIKMTGTASVDIKTLYPLDKEALLKLCENDQYIFTLCNNDVYLYNKILAPTLKLN